MPLDTEEERQAILKAKQDAADKQSELAKKQLEKDIERHIRNEMGPIKKLMEKTQEMKEKKSEAKKNFEDDLKKFAKKNREEEIKKLQEEIKEIEEGKLILDMFGRKVETVVMETLDDMNEEYRLAPRLNDDPDAFDAEVQKILSELEEIYEGPAKSVQE